MCNYIPPRSEKTKLTIWAWASTAAVVLFLLAIVLAPLFTRL